MQYKYIYVVTPNEAAKTKVLPQEEADKFVIFKTNLFINSCIHLCGCLIVLYFMPLHFYAALLLQIFTYKKYNFRKFIVKKLL